MNIFKIDKIDPDEIVRNLRFQYSENFVAYLKEVWIVRYINIYCCRTCH